MTLTVLCSMFGRGMETGYLLLRPAAAIIGSFAALIDAATAMFGCYIVANNTRTIERHRSSWNNTKTLSREPNRPQTRYF